MLFNQYGGNAWEFFADNMYLILSQEEEQEEEGFDRSFEESEAFLDDDFGEKGFYEPHRMNEED